MLKVTTENYLLSPILDHKLKHDLGGVEIQIEKQYENNLRLRNCQLGIVEAIPTGNPLNLSLGDIVFVHHLTFQRTIGRFKEFIKATHVVYEGKEIYLGAIRNIFFKYNKKEIEPVGEVIIVGPVQKPKIEGIDTLDQDYDDRGVVLYPTADYDEGDIVMVEKHALYEIDLPGIKMFKVFRSEVMARLDGEDIYPAQGRMVVFDIGSIASSFLDLSMIKQEPTVNADVIKVGEMFNDGSGRFLDPNSIRPGQRLVRMRNTGREHGKYRVINLLDGNVKGVLC